MVEMAWLGITNVRIKQTMMISLLIIKDTKQRPLLDHILLCLILSHYNNLKVAAQNDGTLNGEREERKKKEKKKKEAVFACTDRREETRDEEMKRSLKDFFSPLSSSLLFLLSIWYLLISGMNDSPQFYSLTQKIHICGFIKRMESKMSSIQPTNNMIYIIHNIIFFVPLLFSFIVRSLFQNTRKQLMFETNVF